MLLTEANEYTGGLCVIPGTHRVHDAFSQRHPWAKTGGDFLPVPSGDPILAAGEQILLCANAGDMLLWVRARHPVPHQLAAQLRPAAGAQRLALPGGAHPPHPTPTRAPHHGLSHPPRPTPSTKPPDPPSPPTGLSHHPL